MKVRNTIGVVILTAMPLVAGADFKMPKMPDNPLSADQTACMQKALGNNFKPTTKQLTDATKSCANPPKAAAAAPKAAAAPPAAAAKPAAAKPAAAAPAKADDSDD